MLLLKHLSGNISLVMYSPSHMKGNATLTLWRVVLCKIGVMKLMLRVTFTLISYYLSIAVFEYPFCRKKCCWWFKTTIAISIQLPGDEDNASLHSCEYHDRGNVTVVSHPSTKC